MNEKDRMNILAGIGINTLNNGLDEIKVSQVKHLEAIEVIDKYDYLQKAFKYILLNSKSNYNPYHNLNHLMTVLKYCHQGAIAEGLNDDKEVRELLVAAIFHDANHSGGKKTDDLNIKDSKKIIKEFIESEGIDVDLESINSILDATEYPYKIEAKDLNISQKIIRDSDLMQVYEYNWIQQNIGGLSQELNMNFIDFLKPQRKFLEAIEFNTTWGKKLKKDKWKDVMKQFKMLEDTCLIKLKSE